MSFIDYVTFLSFFFWIVETYGIPTGNGYSLYGPKSYFIIAFWLVYFPIAEAYYGRTLGKRVFDLTVKNRSGNPITFTQGIKRHLLDIVDLPFLGIVALISAKSSLYKQRLGDRWAKTFVINQQRSESMLDQL